MTGYLATAADALARKGSENPHNGPEPFIGINNTIIRAETIKDERAGRSRLWKNIPALRQAKALLGDYNLKRLETVIRLNRNQLRILTGFLTGLCRLKAHLKKIGSELGEDGQCRFCKEKEEPSLHIACECEALAAKRFRHFGWHLDETKDIISVDPLHILGFLRDTELMEVL